MVYCMSSISALRHIKRTIFTNWEVKIISQAVICLTISPNLTSYFVDKRISSNRVTAFGGIIILDLNFPNKLVFVE